MQRVLITADMGNKRAAFLRRFMNLFLMIDKNPCFVKNTSSVCNSVQVAESRIRGRCDNLEFELRSKD